MNRIGMHTVVAVLVAVLFQAGAGAETAEKPAADHAQISRWIELLDHDDFQKREEASRKLIEAGEPAISAVAKAAASDSQEVAWRSGVILQQIGISGDEVVMAKVVRAMADLEKSGLRSFKQSGAEIIGRWKKHRDQRAVATVRGLGGEVVDSAAEVFAAGFGGFGGGIAPGPVLIREPVVVDFDDLRIEIVEREGGVKVLKDVDGLKAKIEEEAKADKPLGPVKPLAIPKLPDIDFGAEPAQVDAPSPKEESDAEPDGFQVEEVERFVEELKKGEAGGKPLALRIAPKRGERVKELEEEGDPEADLEDVIDLFDADDAAIDAPALADPAVAVFGGGFAAGGAVAWDVSGTSQPSRLVRLGKGWKGSSAGLRVLREIAGLSTLELHDFDLDGEAIKQIARLKKLRRLQVQHSRFEREKLLALKRAKPELSVYATGKTLLGVSGQRHGDGFMITQVVGGSAASKAGIKTGDVITQADGIKLTSVDELTIAIAHKEVGDPLAVTFQRGDELQEVVVKLGPRHATR